MRRLLAMSLMIGAGAIAFAAASQAGISLRPVQVEKAGMQDSNIVTKYDMPVCRIERTLQYDFNGNPYVKKVRVCA